MSWKKILEKNMLYLIIKILITIFYGFYVIGMLVGLIITNNTIGLGTVSRFYWLEIAVFNSNQVWSYFHIFSLGTIAIILTFMLLTKEPKELLGTEMLYSFGTYLTMVGIALFALGCMNGVLFELVALTTLAFGIILWLSTLLEQIKKIDSKMSNLLKSCGALTYFLGLTVTTFRNTSNANISIITLFNIDTSSMFFPYGIVKITDNVISRSFLPTFPDWIFGGLIWLLLAFYWGLDFLQDKSIIRKTAKTRSVILTAVVIIYTMNLLLFSLFFMGFGPMQGASIKIMFTGNIIGILASIAIGTYLVTTKGWLKKKEKPPTVQPTTLDTKTPE